MQLGHTPHLVLGDLDSLPPEALAEITRRHISVESYPRNKDATDGQLAIARAAALAAPHTRLWLVGFLGGPRQDHGLALLLAATQLTPRVTLLDGRTEMTFARPGQPAAWATSPRELVSLIPLTATAEGVQTWGLRWPLRDEPLPFGATRGVSNEPVSDVARVAVTAGVLLVTRYFPL
jgi:thiamine pyrophosphokinase